MPVYLGLMRAKRLHAPLRRGLVDLAAAGGLASSGAHVAKLLKRFKTLAIGLYAPGCNRNELQHSHWLLQQSQVHFSYSVLSRKVGLLSSV